MSRVLIVMTAVLALALPLAAVPVMPDKPVAQVELKDHLNVKLKDNLHSNDFVGNNLASLPTGKQKMGGVEFLIGDGVVQLGSANVKEKPEKVEGIKVGGKCKKLHFLHATGYYTTEGTAVGKYVVHYDDKSTEEIKLVYGEDVVDWWVTGEAKAPTKSKIAWEGENDAVKQSNGKIKLYLTTWENPHPKKAVTTIDFVATAQDTGVAPFCVAITAEEK